MAGNNKEFTDFVNILLLGERGIGKSTLINAFANYARFQTLKDAEDVLDFECLIRTQIIASTSDGEPKILESMSSNKTIHELGNFKTQEVTAYEIPYKGTVMRLIDTPGITSTKIEYSASCAMILEFIAALKHLHGVCVVIKPDLTRITSDFMYNLLMYITKLGRSVVGNIIFLFTRTRRSNYMALDSITCIRPLLDDIASKQHLHIPLRYRKAEHKNCFCFENECFNHLVARAQNVQIHTSKACLEESWTVSKHSMSALLDYITGDSASLPLEPYILPDIELINNTRVLIFEMTTPLIDLADLMVTNLDLHLMKQKTSGKKDTKLEMSMLTLATELELTPLQKAVATCIKCQTDCPLQDIQEESTSQGKLKLNILDTCKICNCESTMHLLRYYTIRKMDTPSEMNTMVDYDLYDKKYQIVMECLAYFSDYLSQHAFKAIKDAYYEYLLYKIDITSARGKPTLHRRYKWLLNEYLNAKQILAIKKIHLTAQQIVSYIKDLKNNSFIGCKLTELYELRHYKQDEYTSMPMEVDQEMEQLSALPGSSILCTPSKTRTPTPGISQSPHLKKRQIIKLIADNNFKESLKLLTTLINDIEGITDEASTEQPKLDSMENVLFSDTLQNFNSNVYEPLKTKNVPLLLIDEIYHWRHLRQTEQDINNIAKGQFQHKPTIAQNCIYNDFPANNITHERHTNVQCSDVTGITQFHQQTNVISPIGGSTRYVRPASQASVNISQTRGCYTKPSLYPIFTSPLYHQYQNVPGNNSKINTTVPRTHVQAPAEVSRSQTALCGERHGIGKAREQQQLCERHPEVYMEECGKKGKNKKGGKNKSLINKCLSFKKI